MRGKTVSSATRRSDSIAPAVEDARREGLDATGPLPNDTLFYHALAGDYDAVVAMYHDQGHIALKTVGFQRAVNVTLGLPIVRTSVAHGTAFDIAGKGLADASSLIAAVRSRRADRGRRPAAQRRMISASTQFVSIVPGQTERISGSAQPSWASAARCTRTRRAPGRSITPGGSGPIGWTSNRRVVDVGARPRREARGPGRSRSRGRPGIDPPRPRIRASPRGPGRSARACPPPAAADSAGPTRPPAARAEPALRPCLGTVPGGWPAPSPRRGSRRRASGSRRAAGSGRSRTENGTCGNSNSQEPERPTVRTRAWSTSRCGPFSGKSSGTIANATSPAPGLPRREFLQRGAAGADDPVGPFQVLGSHARPGHRAGRGLRSVAEKGISACRPRG